MKDFKGIARGRRVVLNHVSRKAAFLEGADVEDVSYAVACRAVLSGRLPASRVAERGKRPGLGVYDGVRTVHATRRRAGREVLFLALDQLKDNPFQTRIEDPERVERLAASIRQMGMLQRVVARPASDGTYELAFGMTRLRAHRLLALDDPFYSVMEVEVCELTDEDMTLLCWEENSERTDLSPIEKALFIRRLLDGLGWTHEMVAAHLSISRPQVTNKLRLLRLPEAIQRDVHSGAISERQAQALLGAQSDAEVEQLAREAASGRGSNELRRAVAKGQRRVNLTSAGECPAGADCLASLARQLVRIRTHLAGMHGLADVAALVEEAANRLAE